MRRKAKIIEFNRYVPWYFRFYLYKSLAKVFILFYSEGYKKPKNMKKENNRQFEGEPLMLLLCLRKFVSVW